MRLQFYDRDGRVLIVIALVGAVVSVVQVSQPERLYALAVLFAITLVAPRPELYAALDRLFSRIRELEIPAFLKITFGLNRKERKD
jgi:hypothetical protein